MLVVIKGAGDLATGIACRLFRCGFALVMTETARPTTVRCTVAFSQAVYRGSAQVEDIPARLAAAPEEALALTGRGFVAVLVDPSGTSVEALRPDVVVDAVLAKRNLSGRGCSRDATVMPPWRPSAGTIWAASSGTERRPPTRAFPVKSAAIPWSASCEPRQTAYFCPPRGSATWWRPGSRLDTWRELLCAPRSPVSCGDFCPMALPSTPE